MSNLGSLSPRDIRGAFYARLEQNGFELTRTLASRFNSDQAGEDYRWLGGAPNMRELIDGRIAKGLRDYGIYIRNKPFEATLEIDADDLRRDKTGQILVRINELADRASTHWHKLLIALIVEGETRACYDGSAFFDSDHSEGLSGVQSNTIGVDLAELPLVFHGTPERPTPAEAGNAILDGVQQLLGFKDDQGDPLNEEARRFVVVANHGLAPSMLSALSEQLDTGGDPSPIPAATAEGFRFSLFPSPRIPWSNAFAVFRTDNRIRPFILQEEVPVEFSALADGSEIEFEHRVHRYGLYASGNVGYGMWQGACLVTME